MSKVNSNTDLHDAILLNLQNDLFKIDLPKYGLT